MLNEMPPMFILIFLSSIFVGVGLLIISEIIQRIYFWVDDNTKEFDNWICSIVLCKVYGYKRTLISKNNSYRYHYERGIDTADTIIGGGLIILLNVIVGLLINLVIYFPYIGISLVLCMGILYLTRMVKRLYKKIDNHILMHE